jgi:hypothetical protein
VALDGVVLESGRDMTASRDGSIASRQQKPSNLDRYCVTSFGNRTIGVP